MSISSEQAFKKMSQVNLAVSGGDEFELPASETEAKEALVALFASDGWVSNRDPTSVPSAIAILKAFPALVCTPVCEVVNGIVDGLTYPIHHFLINEGVNLDIVEAIVALDNRCLSFHALLEDELLYSHSLRDLWPLHLACTCLPPSKGNIIQFLVKRCPRAAGEVVLKRELEWDDDDPYEEPYYYPLELFLHRHYIQNRGHFNQHGEDEMRMIRETVDSLVAENETGTEEGLREEGLLHSALRRAIGGNASPVVEVLAKKIPEGFDFYYPSEASQCASDEFRFDVTEAHCLGILIGKLGNFLQVDISYISTIASFGDLMRSLGQATKLKRLELLLPSYSDEASLIAMESFLQTNQSLQKLEIFGEDCVGNVNEEPFPAAGVARGIVHNNSINFLKLRTVEMSGSDLHLLIQNAPKELHLRDLSLNENEEVKGTTVVATEARQLETLLFENCDQPAFGALFGILPRATNLTTLQLNNTTTEFSHEVSQLGSEALVSLLRQGQLATLDLIGFGASAIQVIEALETNTTLKILKLELLPNQDKEASDSLLTVLQSNNFSLVSFVVRQRELDCMRDHALFDKSLHYALLNLWGRNQLHQPGANSYVLTKLLSCVIVARHVNPLYGRAVYKASVLYGLLRELPSLWAMPETIVQPSSSRKKLRLVAS